MDAEKEKMGEKLGLWGCFVWMDYAMKGDLEAEGYTLIAMICYYTMMGFQNKATGETDEK